MNKRNHMTPEEKNVYHQERAQQELDLITYLLKHYRYDQQRTAIQRARKRRKYHEDIARGRRI